MSEHEILKSVWLITERKNGATYKTKFVENRWVDLEDSSIRPDDNPDMVWGSPHNYVGIGIRRKDKPTNIG